MNTINLFWFSKKNLQNVNVTNFGDDINPLLVQRITGKQIKWTNTQNQNFYKKNFTKIYMAIGSILHFSTNNCTIWGSGLIDSKSEFAKNANYIAVRGPQTFKILKSAGCKVNSIFGDPALLLPKYFDIKKDMRFPLGIIPHYTEISLIPITLKEDPNICIIDLREDPIKILIQINQCEHLLSSSLHGIIVGMAYGIPTLRISISKNIYGDGIKYDDYYQSIGIDNHKVYNLDLSTVHLMDLLKLFKEKRIPFEKIEKIQNKLLMNIPF